MGAATTLASTVGVQHACATLGVSRARFYRQRSPQWPVASEPEGSTALMVRLSNQEPDRRRGSAHARLATVFLSKRFTSATRSLTVASKSRRSIMLTWLWM